MLRNNMSLILFWKVDIITYVEKKILYTCEYY